MQKINLPDSSELSALMKTYSPYVAEAKKRVITTLVVFATATIGGVVFYEDLIRFLVGALSLEGVNIVFTTPFQFINLALACGAVTGLAAIVPLIIFQILHFIKPALSVREYRLVTRFVPFSLVLFGLGFVFGVYIMKWQTEIFLGRSAALGIGNILDVSSLLSTVFVTAAFMGLGFQFPIVLLMLTRVGMLTHRQLVAKRKWVYLGSFMFALLLPPDSILADILLAMPLAVLYEFTLLLDLGMERKTRLSAT